VCAPSEQAGLPVGGNIGKDQNSDSKDQNGSKSR